MPHLNLKSKKMKEDRTFIGNFKWYGFECQGTDSFGNADLIIVGCCLGFVIRIIWVECTIKFDMVASG